MATANYPQINGVEVHTLTDTRVKIDGRPYYGFDKITWSNTVEGAELIYGTEFEPLAETKGTYKGAAEFDILLSEYIALTNSLGGDYLIRRWNFTANIRADGGQLHTIFIPRCRIIDDSVTLERGKATYKSIKCSVLGRITINGKPAPAGLAASSNTIASLTGTATASFGL